MTDLMTAVENWIQEQVKKGITDAMRAVFHCLVHDAGPSPEAGGELADLGTSFITVAVHHHDGSRATLSTAV